MRKPTVPLNKRCDTMIPLCVPSLDGNEATYLQECITSTFVSSVGPFVDRLESMCAQAAGAQGGVATSSGTTALHLALVTIGVRPGDLVIMPSYTFIASANAISHAGATPWLMDISPQSWTLDPDLLARCLETETTAGPGGTRLHTASGRRVAAILPVHTLGHPSHMAPIVATARAFGLNVVADGAAALGARYQGTPMGQWGADLSCVSFNGNKTVTAGGGGMVLGDDPDLLARARHLSTTGRIGADYTHDQVAFNYRLTNLQAAVGCAQLERLDQLVSAKHRIRDRYDRELGALPGIDLFPRVEWGRGSDWFSGVLLKDADTVTQARTHLRQAGIDARPFWKPMHLQPPYQDAPRTPMPVADGIWPRVLTLPCSTGLSEQEQTHVIATARDFVKTQ